MKSNLETPHFPNSDAFQGTYLWSNLMDSIPFNPLSLLRLVSISSKDIGMRGSLHAISPNDRFR